MQLTTEQRDQVAAEVKNFAANLHLSNDQKEKLQNAFQDARGKLGDYMKEHPGVTKADIAKEAVGPPRPDTPACGELLRCRST